MRTPKILYRWHQQLTCRMFDGRRLGVEHRAALAVVRWALNRFELTQMFGRPW